MASIVGKKRGKATYYYLVESARVNGKPRIVSQEYLGTAEELAAAMRGGGLGLPDRTQHRDFGEVAAAWGVLEDLGAAGIIDEVTGARRSDAGASAGTYLALAALGRLVAPCSKLAFADWWATTAAGRFTRIGASALDHRRFWDAMHAVTIEQLEEISHRIALAITGTSGLDCSSVALDMTNFATFIDSGNEKAPIAQRGKAKQKRSDLRLVGLGLVVTRDGGIPLAWHAYPGDKPDVTQFPAMIDALAGLARRNRCGRRAAARGHDGGVRRRAELGRELRSPRRDRAALRRVGTRLRLRRPDRTARQRPRRRRRGPVREADRARNPPRGLRQGTPRDPHPLTRAARRPGRRVHRHHPRQGLLLVDELAATLARGKTRRPRAKVEAEIGKILHDTWARRVITWQLTGDTPREHRLSWHADKDARAALEEEIFGKHVLITDHDDWPAAEVITAYRSQSEAEFSFRQLKDPRVVSFSPMFHWTEHNIRVHVFTCVLALQIAHLMRRKAAQAGLDLSVRALLDQLAGIGETVLLYQGDRGRPRAHRMLTETTPVQDKLTEVFDLGRYAPRR